MLQVPGRFGQPHRAADDLIYLVGEHPGLAWDHLCIRRATARYPVAACIKIDRIISIERRWKGLSTGRDFRRAVLKNEGVAFAKTHPLTVDAKLVSIPGFVVLDMIVERVCGLLLSGGNEQVERPQQISDRVVIQQVERQFSLFV